MFEGIDAGTLAWIAGGLYALGYLIINQVILRLLVLVGTGFYVWYYWVVGDAPLWDAVWVSVVLGFANIIGLIYLMFHRSPLYVPREHLDLYNDKFAQMPPQEFRRLMCIGERRVLTEDHILTYEGQPVSQMHYIVGGTTTIEKLGEVFKVPPGFLVGEVAYLTGRRSSATTYVPEGSEMITWTFDDLQRVARRKPRFKLALEAMISHDLAGKVTIAVAPHTRDWSVERAKQELAQA